MAFNILGGIFLNKIELVKFLIIFRNNVNYFFFRIKMFVQQLNYSLYFPSHFS